MATIKASFVFDTGLGSVRAGIEVEYAAGPLTAHLVAWKTFGGACDPLEKQTIAGEIVINTPWTGEVKATASGTR